MKKRHQILLCIYKPYLNRVFSTGKFYVSQRVNSVCLLACHKLFIKYKKSDDLIQNFGMDKQKKNFKYSIQRFTKNKHSIKRYIYIYIYI